MIIYKNPNGDTRVAPKDVTFEQFQESNDTHIRNVREIMKIFGCMVTMTGEMHDFTKKSEEKMFYQDFQSAIKNEIDFTSGKWYKFHVNTERHHLLKRCPENVNLIDVLEMVVDCTCAGLERSGEVFDLDKISSDILMKAVKNTCELIKSTVEVREK